jgi:hypothetical protein
MQAWGDPDELTRRVMQSQEDRKVIRELTGDGVLF